MLTTVWPVWSGISFWSLFITWNWSATNKIENIAVSFCLVNYLHVLCGEVRLVFLSWCWGGACGWSRTYRIQAWWSPWLRLDIYWVMNWHGIPLHFQATYIYHLASLVMLGRGDLDLLYMYCPPQVLVRLSNFVILPRHESWSDVHTVNQWLNLWFYPLSQWSFWVTSTVYPTAQSVQVSDTEHYKTSNA